MWYTSSRQMSPTKGGRRGAGMIAHRRRPTSTAARSPATTCALLRTSGHTIPERWPGIIAAVGSIADGAEIEARARRAARCPIRVARQRHSSPSDRGAIRSGSVGFGARARPTRWLAE